MTSITFFLFFIPLLALILLAVNLMFAPHNSYQEKNSAFECGFHSFLGQNRTQFSISFFIFALLFLLFDLEILLVYPYVVSSYNNGIYGLMLMLIFFLALTLGFAFELGKNALKIDSRQMFALKSKSSNITTYISIIHLPDVITEDYIEILIEILLLIIVIALIPLVHFINLPSVNWYFEHDVNLGRRRPLCDDEMKARLIYLETRQLEYNAIHGRITTYSTDFPVDRQLTFIDKEWLHTNILQRYPGRYTLKNHDTLGPVLVRGTYNPNPAPANIFQPRPRAIYPSPTLINDIIGI